MALLGLLISMNSCSKLPEIGLRPCIKSAFLLILQAEIANDNSLMMTGNSYEMRVEPQDVDFTLRAKASAMCNNILNIAGTDAQRNGFGVDALMRNNCSWVLSRLAVEFDSLPEQFTSFSIRTWVNYDGRLLSSRNFVLTDEKGAVFGRAVSQWAMINFETRRPTDLNELAESYTSILSDEPSPCERPRKLFAAEPQQTAVHKIVYSDIDFNRHVNTLRYMDMMTDMLPIETLANPRPVRLDFHFVKESRYGQTLTVGLEQRGDTSLFEIKSDDGAVICRASFEWR